MIMIQSIHKIVDLRIRQTCSIKYLQPFLRRFRHRDCFNCRLKNIPILYPRGIDSESLVIDPFWLSEAFA